MITAIVLTKNEEKNIKVCLATVKWCDEILVIDDNSTDKTREIAKSLGSQVIKHDLAGDFSKQRNFGLKQAKHDWVLFLDADERLSEELKEEIQTTLKENGLGTTRGFYFKRYDYFLGKLLKHGEMASIKILRLGQRGSGVWQRTVDEKWIIDGKTETFKNPLFHYSHSNLTQFLENINERSTMNAEELYSEGIRITFFDWFKPLGKFLQNYFFRFGFLDGLYGFVFAILMSFHSFLVRGKLYILWKKGGGWR